LMKFIIPFFSIIFLNKSAWAAVPASTQVYVTWGDFDVVVNTFERVALMVSDSTYHGLFFGLIVIAIVFGIVSSFGRGFLIGQSDPLAWVRVFGTIIIGVIIYQTFIQSTDQIVIYDETLNLQKTVSNVPDGLILLAGISNKIEKGLVDIIWTSSDPYSFKEAAGGSIFNLLKNAYGKNVNLNNMPNSGVYIQMTLQRYIDDCLLYEIARPGTTININDFNNTLNLENILALAQNDAIFTVIYNDTFRSGLTGTCTECWTEINNYLTSLTATSDVVERFYREACGESGLLNVPGTTGPDVYLTNAAKLTAFVSALLGSTVSKSQLVTQKLIADELWVAINKGDSEIIANRKTGVSMAGMGNMANDWIPILKGLVFAIFIGLFPFVCLLIPTPLFGRAISFMFGSFLFLTAWGICDALIHSFAMDKAVALFTEISTSGLGLNSTLMFESKASKALAMFGAARWSSMMLAGVLSAMIARFGGYAMSQFTTQMSMAKMHGSEAEAIVSSPDSRAYQLHSLEGAIPSQRLSNEHGFNKMAEVDNFRKSSALEGDIQTIKELGHGNLNTAIDRKSYSSMVSTVGAEARATALGVDGARDVERVGAIEQKSRSKALGSGGADVKGSAAGTFERIQGEMDSQYLEKHGDAYGRQHFLDRERSTANSYLKQGVAEQVSNGEVSEKTKATLNKINDSQYGHQMLQEAGQNISFANISSEEAGRFNEMAHHSGFQGFHAQSGDRVNFSAAYDDDTGGFQLSNIQASQTGQESRGEVYSKVNKRTLESVDDKGVHVETQTMDGKTVLESTTAGKRVDAGSRVTTGDLKTIYDDRTIFQSGFDAHRSAAANVLFKETGSMPVTATLLGAARDASLITQFANPVTQWSAGGLLGADGLNQLQEAFKLDKDKVEKSNYEPLNPRFAKPEWD